MPSTTDISPLSITDGKISNEARIAHAKLAKATEGQVLVAQANGKFAAKSLAGDVTLDSSGNTTSNVAVSADGTTVVTGATGATGVKGSTGSQGAAGATGVQGATGSQGATGAAGATGATGAAGADGTDGATGATGAAGAGGSDGSDGATGPQGVAGTTGDAGAAGATGATGATGAAGATGDAGADGAAGADGTNGTNGTNGADGAAGATGATGAAGSDGTDGADGATGATGAAGATGATGPQGATGATGAAGADGSDASVTATNVDDALHGADTHDSRYYQESEFLNASAGAGDAGKPVKLDAGGHIDTSMINDGDISFVDLEDIPSTFAPSSHNHAASEITSGTLHADRYTNTTYTADDGIALSGGAFSVAAGTGLTQNGNGLELNLQGVTEAAVRVDDDYLVFLDGGSTGAAKKESIADLATAMAGTGLTATSGELVVSIGTISGTVAAGTDGFTAHKYTKDITWGTDIGTEVVFSGTSVASGEVSTETCTITHDLGTKYIFVSVIEFSTTDSGGDTNFVENLQEQIDMNFHLTVKPTNDNNIELHSTGSGVYSGSVFKVAIIG